MSLNSTALSLGFIFNHGGNYYEVTTAGTTAAAPVVYDTTTGNTTIDGTCVVTARGLYFSRYGLMLEDSSTNTVPSWQWRLAAGYWTGWGGGTPLTVTQQTNGDLGVDGTANAEVRLTDVDGTSVAGQHTTSVIPADTATHSASVAIRKGSGTSPDGLMYIQITYYGGTAVSATVKFNPTTGLDVWSTSSGITETSNHWIVRISAANNGTNTGLALVVFPTTTAAHTGAITIDWRQIELNKSFSSSLIPAGASRATELGNVKYSTANLPTSGKLTWWMDWKPDFASGDLAAANRILVGFNTVENNTLLGQHAGAVLNIRARDFINEVVSAIPTWNAYDDIQLVVTADDTTSLMQLHYRNVTQDAAWVHSPTSAYDGAFTDTGFAQLFKAGGGNNSHVLALMGWQETKTNTWIEANLP